MSDIDDDPFAAPDDFSDDPPAPKSRLTNADEDDEQDDAPPRRGRDSDEDDDEDDEDEDEEEEEEVGGSSRPKKRRRKRNAGVSMFIDEEAEVDDEDDEDEEDGEDGVGDFIAGPEGEDDVRRTSASHIRRDREFEDRPEDLTAIAEDYAKRYRQSAPTRYTGDLNDVPQRLLMPSVQDANLWQVRVKPGKEREIVLSLMRKSIDLEFTPRPLEILAVFQRDSLPGMIYVEARSSKQVSQAMQGLVGVYPSRGVTLVPIEEMAALLQIKKQDVTVQPGTWVRIRRGKYAGDLAQIMDVTENGEEVGLKFIPRIDLNPRDETVGPDGKKRKKVGGVMVGSVRPPQRFFNFEEVAKVYKRQAVSNRGGVFVFQNDTYRDGFVEKDFRLSALQLDDVNPTLDEITMFSRGQEGAENDNAVDLSIIAEASRKAAIAVLQPGDHVEVFEGEQAGVHGIVHSVAQDIVTITASGVELDGQKIDVPARSVRKRFKAGDHVKVMTGKNSDETGLVVAVSDNIVTFLSDMSLQEVSVFSKDLREAAEVGASTNTVGIYELHDLVQLDAQNVGVIFKTERDSFRVLDQQGQVRLVQPHQISMRRDSNRAIAMDSEGHELRVGDNVKEIEGEARKGRVLHLHQSVHAFLHNRDYPENGGVFVTRARSLASQIPKGAAVKPGMDTTKMNPSMAGGAGNVMLTMMSARGPRDRLQGMDVKIVKGQFKGHIGIIKDTNGSSARVEVSSKSKIITMELDKLRARKADGSLEELTTAMDLRNGRNNKMSGGMGMGPPSSLGKTPNPYAGGTTPGWTAGRTPNPYAGGGKTPAWGGGDSSRTPAWGRTPNPYANANKTPAWDAGAKTPNPYAVAGSKTPAWGGAQTPNPYGNSSGAATGGWNPTSPLHPSSGGWGDSSSGGSGGWGGASSEPAWNAPASAPTPGIAATPAAWAPTPGFAAPTPGASGGADADELDPDEDPLWLVKFPAESKRGLVVEVQNSDSTDDSADGWHGGKYEGQQAIVITAIQNMMSSGGNVTLKFDSGEEFMAPPKICKRVPPASGNDMVMVIAGKGSGQVVRLISEEGDAWTCLRTNGAYEEFPTSRLCLFRG